MLRIWTYVGMVAGVPANAGVSFDVDIFDVNGNLGKNSIISPLRDGRTRKVRDTRTLYEITGSLILTASDIDLESRATYLGFYRYLAVNLFHHAKYQLPILLFVQGLNDKPNKAYAATIEELDSAIVGQASADDTNIMHFSRMTEQKVWKLGLHTFLTGTWLNFDTVGTVNWESRA